jgi:integrase
VRSEALGQEYAKAVSRAKMLNQQLDSWRKGETSEIHEIGTVSWWLGQYEKSRHFNQHSPDHRKNQIRTIKRLCAFQLPKPTPKIRTFGDMTLTMCSPRFANGFYDLLNPGRARQAEIEVAMLKMAWEVVRRDWPTQFPENPWHGITLVRRQKGVKKAVTREEAYALATALKEIGHPHLGAAALICFEWHQRPHSVCAGAIRWPDYRPGETVTIDHWKTGVSALLPLSDDDGLLFPEIEEYLSELPQLGLPIVLTSREPHRPYPKKTASDAVRRARRHAGLADHVTLDACRHGGLTELGDAELTESQEMALSGHKSVVIRGYIKKTEKQRRSGARKRLDSRTKRAQESE